MCGRKQADSFIRESKSEKQLIKTSQFKIAGSSLDKGDCMAYDAKSMFEEEK